MTMHCIACVEHALIWHIEENTSCPKNNFKTDDPNLVWYVVVLDNVFVETDSHPAARSGNKGQS